MNRARLLRWSLAVGALLVVLAVSFGSWVLRSEGGRDWLLARVLAQLPADSSVRWEGIEGRLSGPLVIHGLDYRQADGLRVQARRVRIDHSVWPLVSRRWQVQSLDGEDVRVTLAREDAPFEWPRWPEVLPRLDLPMAISVRALDFRGLEVVEAERVRLRLDRLRAGVLLAPGELVVRDLRAQGPDGGVQGRLEYRPADDFRTAADLRLQGRDGLSLHVLARGDLTNFVATAEGTAPGRVDARLSLRNGREVPIWQLRMQADELRPALFGLDGADRWRGDLRLGGRGGDASLSGRLARNDVEWNLDGSRLVTDARGLRLAPLRVVLPQGPLQVDGLLAFEPAPLHGELRLSTPGLRLAGSEPGSEVVVATGALQARGTVEAWTLAGQLAFRRGAEEATVVLAGTGTAQTLHLGTLQARMPGGRLDGEADLRWGDAIGGQADLRLVGFDPGYFAPEFPGAIHGRLRLEAKQAPGGRWSGRLDAPGLTGRLRGRALEASATAHWKDGAGEGEARIALGDSRLELDGRFGEQLDLRARAQPLDLADLWPDAGGRLRGSLRLRGPRAAPAIEADLTGADLRWGASSARELRVRGRLPEAPARGQVEAVAGGLVIAGQAVEAARVQLRGNRSELALDASLQGEHGRLAVEGEVRHDADRWQGRLRSLRLSPTRGPAWALQAPARFAYGESGLRFGPGCLAQADGAGELCAHWDGEFATLRGEGLGVALVEPWLPAVSGDYQGYGTVAFDARLQRAATGWSGRVELRSAVGGVRLRAHTDTPLLAYEDLRLQASLADSRWQARGGANLDGGGRLDFEGSGGLAPAAPVAATATLDLRELGWMELLSPDLAAPSGRLQGRLQVGGTRGEPRIGGELRLTGWQAELPALGVAQREGSVLATGEPGGSLRIEGSVRSGEGTLRVEGGLDLRQDRQPLLLSLRGDGVTIADTPDLEATASPRLQLRYLDGELQLRGSIIVPRARVDLERLDRGVAASPDVVVLDPREEAEAGGGLQVDTEVTVEVGDDVRLRGFGLDGRLGGALTIRDGPARPAVANGTLQVRGRYRAYGRALQIRRARMSWVNAPFDDPVLDVLAEHEFEDVTVGVRVRGSARAPETSVTSSPSMSTAEAVSWLLLGRPLETASGAETQQVSASALALGAGSSLLAQRLGVRLGLDSAGVVESRALGGSALLVGKRLSPRLFVSYGVSLLGTGQVVMLKYMIRRGLSLGLESGTVETAASLEWRTER